MTSCSRGCARGAPASGPPGNSLKMQIPGPRRVYGAWNLCEGRGFTWSPTPRPAGWFPAAHKPAVLSASFSGNTDCVVPPPPTSSLKGFPHSLPHFPPLLSHTHCHPLSPPRQVIKTLHGAQPRGQTSGSAALGTIHHPVFLETRPSLGFRDITPPRGSRHPPLSRLLISLSPNVPWTPALPPRHPPSGPSPASGLCATV